ncbi:glucose-6-phosphate isomerase [Aequorivita lipolytica]|uniref:Glucose-6-phosphate isomerase n=1 Tax=Aequorivita lipolytica TaxID=153267 RepID=A0A5C6YPX7_9FLAO|nr:glucose-6-phosphate isomerase [Aequorivita lipolytica]TXD69620.1 glucose-6-phosphate isomerase [Aequorivita lipolytica]SRX51109.1 Glucose-6-phosphate isomerase [Aequorivita lipolytica]
MSLPKINPTKTEAWKALEKHFQEIEERELQDFFSEDGDRAERLKIEWQDFYLDYSKNRITDETISLLLKLAEEVKLKEAINQQFSGDKINETEDRAVLHTALRDFDTMKAEVKATLQKMKSFSEEIINGNHKGFTGKAITDIVNIGIGGSHLGPEMVTEALQFYKNHLKIHFVANIDGDAVTEILNKLNPETTLFIIVSKSFTTQETIANAVVIKDWFLKYALRTDIKNHFVAVSVNEGGAKDFGISEENIFPMQNWVGGRFSLWSSVGLSICCAVGFNNFEAMLKGAFEMDNHFKKENFGNNIPVVLALISIWYNNFFKAESEAVVAYSQYLNKLVPYLQQAVMESNGKSVDRSGEKIAYQTGTIVWGNVGSNSQHAYFQLLHQGTKLIPTDFIGFSESLHGNVENHNILIANFFAQTEALWEGTHNKSVENAFKLFEGYKPTNTLLIKKLTPKNLGSLIALYEHKLFVQGIIWNIFSYDQWGVELGKTVAKGTLNAIENNDISNLKNDSTKNLIKQVSLFQK